MRIAQRSSGQQTQPLHAKPYNCAMNDTIIPMREAAARRWAEQVRGNREQVERVREVPDGADFYGPIAHAFRSDPHRTDDAVLNAVLELVIPGETWLDIGAGGGRFGLPIALKAGELIAVDPSDGMLEVLRSGMDEHDIRNVHIIHDRWPMVDPPEADVAFIANVGMDIEAFDAFLDAMEASARRLCVAVMGYRQGVVQFDQLWPAVHGEQRVALPSLPEFLALLLARGRLFEVQLRALPPVTNRSREDILLAARKQTWVALDSEKDQKLQQLIDERGVEHNGTFALPWQPGPVGIVSWDPRSR